MKLLRAAGAFWTMDRQVRWSYPASMFNQLASMAALVFLFYYGGESIVDSVLPDTQEGGLFLFAIVGYAVLQLMSASHSAYASRVRSAQVSGLLEASMMTRTPAWQILLAMPTYDLASAFTRLAGLLVLAVVLSDAAVTWSGLPAALVFLALGEVSFLALGVISASITLVTKTGDPIARVVNMASFLIAGVFFPRDVLPEWLGTVGGLLPIAPVLDGMRNALFGSVGSITQPALLIQCLVTATLLALAAALIARWSLRRVLTDGSLGHY